MKFKKLVVDNFGLFQDRHVFDLTIKDPFYQKQKKSIILFGGNNGAGKTTLFEAFKICLYGSSHPQFRWKKMDYSEFIRKKIHRNPNKILQHVSSFISLEFEYARLGKIDEYRIERRWHISDQNVEEQFHVFINDKLFEDLDNLHWQDFIRELIPIGVSNLFFFDGEQIQSLADDTSDDLKLKNSFYSLLGLDVIERLQSDLTIHIARNEKQSDEKYERKLENLYFENAQLEVEISNLLQKKGDLENKLGNRQKKIAEIQEKISSEGGAFASKREKMVNDKNNISGRIDQISEEIRQMASGILPFAIVPNYCISLKKRIIEEQNISKNIQFDKKINSVLQSIKTELISEIKKKVGEKTVADTLASDIDFIFNKHHHFNTASNNESDGMDPAKLKIIHHLSSFEQNKILQNIDSALTVKDNAKNIFAELEALTIHLQKTETSLKKAPTDEVIAPLIEELSTISQEIGKVEVMISQMDENINSKRYKQKNNNYQINSIASEKKDYENMQRGLVLANRVRESLKEYEMQVKKEKINQLEESLLDCLSELLHKDLFHKVKIDPDNFSVVLFDKADNMVLKDQLSLGEKQVYAIAMLWALARSSGRPLPFIIDTPLGRLDSEHRLNLVENFFPFASHQVIIFSTDTEIDREYFENLSEHISHSYKLEYNDELGHTKVREGYFWNRDKEDSSSSSVQIKQHETNELETTVKSDV